MRIARTANGELQRNSRNLDQRDANLLNDETNGCPLVTATIWDGVDTLIPICRAHTAPVGPASSTDLGMDTLVCALNGHELLSCSGSATGGLRASPSTNCELRERRTANCSAIREISIDEMRTF